MTPEAVAAKFASSRPGYELVSYGEVGLPFYRITITAHVLEHKPLGPFAEFAMRTIDAGISDSEEIGQLLGLEEAVVDTTLSGLIETDDAALSDSDGAVAVALTAKGQATLGAATAIVPEEAVIEIDYDGLLRRPVPYVEHWSAPIELKDLGIREIPPSPVRPPELKDIDIASLEKLIRVIGDRREAKREILALRSIERRRRFFRAVALVFRGADTADVQVAFVIDGVPSAEHEEKFAGSRYKRKLVGGDSIASAEAVVEGVLGKSIVDEARSGRRDPLLPVPELNEEGEESEEHEAPPRPVAIEDPVRMLETYEHPAFLRDALANSRDRLLIVSPWIRGSIVDRAFLDLLRDRLENGVDVFIGWGITPPSEEDIDIDAHVLRAFKTLEERFTWTFHARRLGNTHAKLLISDRRFLIVTSFNWLSFKGDPRRTFRDERGTFVSIPEKINAQFDDWSKRIRSKSK